MHNSTALSHKICKTPETHQKLPVPFQSENQINKLQMLQVQARDYYVKWTFADNGRVLTAFVPYKIIPPNSIQIIAI
jgi:hypothetical protein